MRAFEKTWKEARCWTLWRWPRREQAGISAAIPLERATLASVLVVVLAAIATPGVRAERGTALSDSSKTRILSNSLPEAAIIEFVAEPGTTVRQGEIVVVLDCVPWIARLRDATKTLAAAQEEIKANDRRIAHMDADNSTKVEAAAYEALQAERSLEKYVEGDAPGAALLLQLALTEAKSDFDQQLDRFNSRDKLLKEGYIQKVEYENEGVRMKKAQLTLDAAKLKLETFEKFERVQMTDQCTRILEEKKKALRTLQTQLNQDAAAARSAGEILIAKEKAAQAECERLREMLRRCFVTAPIGGQFKPGDVTHAECKPELGSTALPGQVLGTITPGR